MVPIFFKKKRKEGKAFLLSFVAHSIPRQMNRKKGEKRGRKRKGGDGKGRREAAFQERACARNQSHPLRKGGGRRGLLLMLRALRSLSCGVPFIPEKSRKEKGKRKGKRRGRNQLPPGRVAWLPDCSSPVPPHPR